MASVRVVLHEWCCSGGLRGSGTVAGVDGGEPTVAGLVAEGSAMLRALLSDGLRAADLEFTLLLDPAARSLFPSRDLDTRVSVVHVPPGGERDALAEAAADADWTLVVAPETDGILADRVALARRSGGQVASPDDAFLTLAADKQQTALALAGAGVGVPAGCLLPSGASLADEFRRPAVAKALAGCGGDGLTIVPAGGALPPAPVPRRVEAFVPGMPVGVSCLCGPIETVVLHPVRQRFSPGPNPRYLGGDLHVEGGLAGRAMALAARSIRGLVTPGRRPLGWVGVDMILGSRDDGADDRVLEINPRLTTSFVGLSSLGTASLLRALLAVAGGERCVWPGASTGASGAFAVAGDDGRGASVERGDDGRSPH
jgi:predicted ATP-grasp superfamily ATP-dependent carboligase